MMLLAILERFQNSFPIRKIRVPIKLVLLANKKDSRVFKMAFVRSGVIIYSNFSGKTCICVLCKFLIVAFISPRLPKSAKLANFERSPHRLRSRDCFQRL